jgi:hypothetical protein
VIIILCHYKIQVPNDTYGLHLVVHLCHHQDFEIAKHFELMQDHGSPLGLEQKLVVRWQKFSHKIQGLILDFKAKNRNLCNPMMI